MLAAAPCSPFTVSSTSRVAKLRKCPNKKALNILLNSILWFEFSSSESSESYYYYYTLITNEKFIQPVSLCVIQEDKDSQISL